MGLCAIFVVSWWRNKGLHTLNRMYNEVWGCGKFGRSLELENRIFVAENPVCALFPTFSLGSLTIVVCPVNNSCNFAGNYELSFWSWNDIITQTNEAPVLRYITARPSFQRRRKIRRHRRPWACYSMICL